MYQRIITELGGPANLAFAIEELMRDQYSTLDHLDRTTFKREIKLALKTITEIRALAARGDAMGLELMTAYRITAH
jgi:hypothetical protein